MQAGEGGFVESCIEHVAAQGSNFDKYAINGVTEVDAFTAWWKSDGEPASKHWYVLPICTSLSQPVVVNVPQARGVACGGDNRGMRN